MPSSGYSVSIGFSQGALLSVVCVQSVSAGGKVQRKKESTHLDRIGMAIDKTIDDFAWNRRKVGFFPLLVAQTCFRASR